MFDKLHLLSQDAPEGGGGLRWRAHPYLRMVGSVPKGPAVFEWNQRQREDLEALWRDPDAEGARERLARDLAALCEKLGWSADTATLEDAEKHGDEFLLTISAVPPELYLLPWEVIQADASGTYLSDFASAQVRYAVPGLDPRPIRGAPPEPGVLFAWSSAGGAVPHEAQGQAIRAAAEAGGVVFRELAEVGEASLQAALDAGPPSVLHLLCHGLPGPEGEPPRLKWGASDDPSEIAATRLARMLRRHSDAIRLVVLSACGSGDGHGDPLFIGSMAQELHRKGIPNVVASRYPLTVSGSRTLTRALYDQLLAEAWSLERSLRHARAALFRVDDDGHSHPGDAYGIQLYAHDSERFVSDNEVEAVRPVLSSYPFGTSARPVPASGPPTAELTIGLEADPGLDEDELAAPLRRVSEDDDLQVSVGSRVGKHALSLIVRTSVDGAQRLLGAWRSKLLQTAVGVIVGELILTKGIMPAFAATPSATVGKAAKAGKTTSKMGKVSGKAGKTTGKLGKAMGKQAATGGKAAAAPGQAAASSSSAGASAGSSAATAGKAAAATTLKTGAGAAGKATFAIAGKAITAKLAVVAVIGGVAAVGGGVVAYRAAVESEPTAPVALVAENELAPSVPAPEPAPAVVDAAPAPLDAAAPDAAVPDAVPAVAPPALAPATAPRPAPKPTAASAKNPASKPTAASAKNPASKPTAASAKNPASKSPADGGPATAVTATGPALYRLSYTTFLAPGKPATPLGSKDYQALGKIGFIVPAQASASGPTAMVWSLAQEVTKLPIQAKNEQTGATQQLTLTARRLTAKCGYFALNSAAASTCPTPGNTLEFTILAADNAAVPKGVYTGSFKVQAQEWKDGPIVEDLIVEYKITIDTAVTQDSDPPPPPTSTDAGPETL